MFVGVGLVFNCKIVAYIYVEVSAMVKILFVCHGNICRSPMAEFIMKDIVKKRGSSADFYIESAATDTDEI